MAEATPTPQPEQARHTPIVVTRHFQPYTSDQRSNHAASHRLGHQQRRAIGEAFWTSAAVPGVAFKTRKAAIAASTSEVQR
jgi:hypothetical protein